MRWRQPSLAPDEGEPFPDPAPYKNQRSPPLPVFVAVPCPPVFEPPVYCEESTGLFRSELLPARELDEPAPEPELLGSAKPPELEPLLPVGDETAPKPELLGSASPPELELPLPFEDEPALEPELLGSVKPPALGLPLPVGAEPAPEPELLGSARSPALELPLPVGDEPVPEPELLGSARPVD